MKHPDLFIIPNALDRERIHRASRQRAVELRSQAVDAFWARVAVALQRGALRALHSLKRRPQGTPVITRMG